MLLTRLPGALFVVASLVSAPFLTGCSGAADGSTGASNAADSTGDDDDGGAVTPVAPTNFAKVRDGLYRGAHPDQANLAYLKGLGVTTIVDLEIADLIEATPGEIAEELSEAEAMGFTVIREPLSAFQPFVSDREMNDTLDILAGAATNGTDGAVYVHCRHGQDRTGMVVGLERVLIEGWEPADAYAEMLQYGFHPAFIGLRHYFDEKTGYDP